MPPGAHHLVEGQLGTQERDVSEWEELCVTQVS